MNLDYGRAFHALEFARRMESRQVISAVFRDYGDVRVDDMTDDNKLRLTDLYAAGIDYGLNVADPYFIASEIVDLIVAGAESWPEGNKLHVEDFPSLAGWLHLEKHIDLPECLRDKALAPYITDFMFVILPAKIIEGHPVGQVIDFHALGPVYNPETGVTYQVPIPIISMKSQELPGALLKAGDATIVQAEYRPTAKFLDAAIGGLMAFMSQPFVVTEKVRVERTARRQFARTHGGQEPSAVRVVTLRKRVYEKASESAQEGTEGHRHVSVRFLVRGFWRQQWYPTQGRHRPVWIHPYEKGPQGAPLKVRKDLFAVVR